MRPRKVDGNHAEITRAFRACGFQVHDTSRVGHGFPDLVVYRPSHGLVLVEVKDGSLSPSRRKLTSDEDAFGKQFPVRLITSTDDVLAFSSDAELWRRHV